ncbi:1, 4-beta cellobiohydrolase [Cladochytrium replicatum]|nr:1, 4-beta cellobiohydrolase [Cladochytrium replicatum]
MRTALIATLALLVASSSSALAQSCQTVYGQCGGIGWNSPTCCNSGSYCTTLNPYYAQCTPGTGPATTATSVRTTTTTTTSSTTTPTTRATTTTTTVPRTSSTTTITTSSRVPTSVPTSAARSSRATNNTTTTTPGHLRPPPLGPHRPVRPRTLPLISELLYASSMICWSVLLILLSKVSGNSYQGFNRFVNADLLADVDGSIKANSADNTFTSAATRLRQYPSFKWVDQIAAISYIQPIIDQAAAQSGSSEIIVELVIYDLPGRDCAALASNRELPAGSLARYKAEYIDVIAKIFKAKLANIRLVLVIEPDSLPNLAPNIGRLNCNSVITTLIDHIITGYTSE